MELTAWTIYWVGKLDAIKELLTAVAVLSGALGLVGWIFYTVNMLDEDLHLLPPLAAARLRFRRALLWFTWTLGASLVGAVLMPGTAHMSAMLVAPKVARYVEGSETLKQLPDQIVEAASGWLKEKASVGKP